MANSEEVKELKEKIKSLEEKCKNITRDKLILNSLLEKTSKDLQKALQAQRNFIAMISHEIRTPLNSIIGFLELLQNSNLTPHQKHLLSNAHKSSLHLLSLINKVLDISKIEAGQLEVIEEEFDLEELMMDCAVIISSRVREGVKLITDIPNLPFTLKGDPIRIKQIFLNLLGNAAKFTKEGYIKFSIEKYEEKEDKLFINILIEDTGPGISPEKLTALFQPFQQLNHPSKETGTGLGLYFSKSLLSVMGGNINVESTPGKGSKFYINLPLKKSGPKKLHKIFSNKKIGAILREGTLKDALIQKFKTFGIEVVDLCPKNHLKKECSECMRELFLRLLEEKWDLIILDEEKIENGGLYLAGILKIYNPSVKIIYLTDRPYLFKEQKEFDEVLHRNESFYKIFCFINTIFSEENLLEKRKEERKDIKILIAEDEELNQELFRELFNTYFKLQIDIAKDGYEAIEKAKTNKYDIIFMDIRMPKVDGLKATEEIRKFDKDVHIIAISANAFSEDIERAKKAGMNGYIYKPIEIDKLKRIMDTTINKNISSSFDNYKECAPIRPPNKEDLKEIMYTHFKKLFGELSAKKLTEKSIKNINDILKRLEKNIRTENKEEVIKNLHSLKGVLLNSGLKCLSEEAGLIEKELKEGANIPSVHEKIKKSIYDKLSLFNHSQ